MHVAHAAHEEGERHSIVEERVLRRIDGLRRCDPIGDGHWLLLPLDIRFASVTPSTVPSSTRAGRRACAAHLAPELHAGGATPGDWEYRWPKRPWRNGDGAQGPEQHRECKSRPARTRGGPDGW